MLAQVSTAVLSSREYPVQLQGQRIYMMDTASYTITDAINPHMRSVDGSLNVVDYPRAKEQWEKLKETYEELGFTIDVLSSAPHCPDMVFCANQIFPFVNTDGKPSIIVSNMANDSRQNEVDPIVKQLHERGITPYFLEERNVSTFFEGMGDALWVPGRKLICGGYGPRTKKEVYESLTKITGATVHTFELNQPKFYHLDTCLSILNENTVLACREGFTEQGWIELHQIFSDVISVPLTEADSPGFACNAHCPDQKHVIIQRGNEWTNGELLKRGFLPIEVDTDEFIKSGGSVFCMKNQSLWD